MIFFDPVDLFTTIIALDVRGSIHIGLGEFYDAYKQDEHWKAYV